MSAYPYRARIPYPCFLGPYKVNTHFGVVISLLFKLVMRIMCVQVSEVCGLPYENKQVDTLDWCLAMLGMSKGHVPVP